MNSEHAMNEVRLGLARRIVAHHEAGTTDLAPGAFENDIAAYRDPTLFAREYRKLFREMPLVVCLTKDLEQPGSFQLFDDLDIPILVWRGKDGKVRAFLNICGHRGGRLGREACGTASRLTCRYHGWTYDTMGHAVGVPEEEHFDAKIAQQKHLISIPAEERHGLVFVQATPQGTMDLDAHLGAFGQELENLGFAHATRVHAEDFHNSSNWKYTLDTYFENYHVPALHRETFAPTFDHTMRLFDTWGPHHRLTFPNRSVREWVDKPESEWAIGSLPLAYFIFPNVVIAMGTVVTDGGYFSMHRLFPKSVGEMVMRLGIYAPDGVKSATHRTQIGRSFEAIKFAVREEDYSVTGESYPALSALPDGTKFVIGRHEIGVQNFHRNVNRLVTV